MLKQATLFITLCAIGVAPSALAEKVKDNRIARITGRAELPPYLQCVPYAREQSGVRIFGDAHTWWGKAEGRYVRGNQPKIGAVMAFAPHRKMRLGHVAAVSKIIDSRTVLLNHANWSPINGRRGQIENNVKAIDVSPNNDWSQVRVWYHPIQGLGKTAWPVRGFIYSKGAPKGVSKKSPIRIANDVRTNKARVSPPEQWIKQGGTANPVRKQTSPAFTKAFASLEVPAAKPSGQRRAVTQSPVKQQAEPRRAASYRKASPYSARKATPYPTRKATPYPKKRQQASRKPTPRIDPLEAVLLRYED